MLRKRSSDLQEGISVGKGKTDSILHRMIDKQTMTLILIAAVKTVPNFSACSIERDTASLFRQDPKKDPTAKRYESLRITETFDELPRVLVASFEILRGKSWKGSP